MIDGRWRIEMRRFLVAILVVPLVWTAAVVVCSAAIQAGDKAATEKLLVDYERKIHEALANRDRDAFLALAAADGAWATGGSFVPVGMLAGAFDRISVTKWEIVNPHVLWVDQTTAVVGYGWTGTGNFLGQPLAPTRIASTVWTKRGDNWVAVFHQESDAATP
jgi:hypothetical protein